MAVSRSEACSSIGWTCSVADQPIEPDDPALAVAARHALHDEELVAAFAADGDGAEDAARAKTLIERCAACRDLHADLVAIGGALRSSRSAETVAATQTAPRDFRLSAETAERLRPGSVGLRFRDRLAAGLAAFSRPVGMSMASLGVIGLLLGTLTLGGFASLGTATQDYGGTGAAAAAPGSGQLSAPVGAPLASLRASVEAAATASPAPAAENVRGGASVTSGGPAVPALIVGGSAVLLIGGLALMALGSRRREPIPGR